MTPEKGALEVAEQRAYLQHTQEWRTHREQNRREHQDGTEEDLPGRPYLDKTLVVVAAQKDGPDSRCLVCQLTQHSSASTHPESKSRPASPLHGASVAASSTRRRTCSGREYAANRVRWPHTFAWSYATWLEATAEAEYAYLETWFPPSRKADDGSHDNATKCLMLANCPDNHTAGSEALRPTQLTNVFPAVVVATKPRAEVLQV
jgi:hypothetical protein